MDSLPSEPPGKPKNTGVGSPADLPDLRILLGLLHCRWISYQLSYQGSCIRAQPNDLILTSYIYGDVISQ